MATQEADTARAQALEDDGVVSQVQHQVQEKAHDLKGQASQNVRRQLNDRSTEVGEQIHSLGAALRRAAEQLAEDGKTTPAEAARRAAVGVERVGGYLRNGNADDFLTDVERFGRTRPWLTGGLGLAFGFAASRFLKASSGRRYSTTEWARRDLDAPLSRSGAALETGPLRAPSTPPLPGGLPE
jgi:hypothetical protein